jgi:hypothetical protein
MIGGAFLRDKKSRRAFHPVYLFLALPFAALLYVPLFDSIEPRIFGIPFFYWYQMLWTILGAFCILPVYLHEKKQEENRS